MKRSDTTESRPKAFAIPGVLTIFLSIAAAARALAQEPTSAQTSYVPASVYASPGLQCKLHAAKDSATEGISVFTDNDGYARFHAVPAKPGDATRYFALDCTDLAGKSTSYPVDLASNEIFASHPLDLSKEPGKDRPALQGDPLSYSEPQLIEAGYGLRPEPAGHPAAYARWLAAASRPARLLAADRPLLHKRNVSTGTSTPWVGSVLTGTPEYSLVEGTLNVPQAVPGGDQTKSTEISIWVGVGGYGVQGLIQDGIYVSTSPTVAYYGSFQEYCCGDPNQTNGSPQGAGYSPNPGDELYVQAWYCDAQGKQNINGGYGCALVHDMTSGALLNCTSATGSPCASVLANPLCSAKPGTPACFTLGMSAEFIIEDDTPELNMGGTAFTDFSRTVTIAGSAFSQQKDVLEEKTISTDPAVTVLTDFTNTTTHIVVALGTTDQTSFNIEPGQPSFPFYCQGPLTQSPAPTPQTRFVWSPTSASAKAPGEGQCAWADRTPRGTEIKSGGGNVISGYLNQFASLTKGQFVELAVYNDPAADNDMVVTQVIGTVTPPFPASVTLP
jgi:Peptidase A4 family